MKTTIALATLLIICTFPGSAADFQKGFDAYKNGDYATAMNEWRPLAERGHAIAQYNFGIMYENGEGVAQNDAEAVRWYRKAAEQEYARAQNNLGAMYAGGEGIERNYAWAVYWQAKAAQGGHTLATHNIELNLGKLTQLTVIKDNINIRAKPTTKSDVVLKASKGTKLFRLGSQDGWYEVYSRTGHTLGYVADFLVSDGRSSNRTASAGSGPYPAAPPPQPGRTVCRTNCRNGDCYRTYSDGRKVHFQARQKWDPFNNTWTWDSGGC